MQLVRSKSGVGDTNVETLYYLAIASARKSLDLTAAYFVPRPAFTDALARRPSEESTSASSSRARTSTRASSGSRAATRTPSCWTPESASSSTSRRCSTRSRCRSTAAGPRSERSTSTTARSSSTTRSCWASGTRTSPRFSPSSSRRTSSAPTRSRRSAGTSRGAAQASGRGLHALVSPRALERSAASPYPRLPVRSPLARRPSRSGRIDWLLARLRTGAPPARKPGRPGRARRRRPGRPALLSHARRRTIRRPKAWGRASDSSASTPRCGWRSALAGAARDPEKRAALADRRGDRARRGRRQLRRSSSRFGRERPMLEDHPPLARAPSKLSFPSAHSTSSMAAATAFGRVEPRTRVPLYVLATAICLSRPYLGMHYPSDVVAGAVLRPPDRRLRARRRRADARGADGGVRGVAAATEGSEPMGQATEGSDPSRLPSKPGHPGRGVRPRSRRSGARPT